MTDAVAHLDSTTAAPRRVSAWVPMLLWCLIVTAFAQFRQRSISDLFEESGFDAQVKFQAATWLALGCLAAVLALRRRADLRLLSRGPLFWYCCFVAAALASSVYSPAPALTAYRSMQHAVALVLVVSLGDRLEDVYRFIAAYIAVNWIIVVLGLLGIGLGTQWIIASVQVPEWEVDPRWRFGSAFGHPSIISVVAAAGACGLAYRTRGRQWLVGGPIIAWLVLTTILTVSRTAIVGLVGGLAVAALGRRVLAPWVCLLGVAAPLLMLMPNVEQSVSNLLARGQSKEEIYSLTGRIQAYQEASRRIEHSWPIGQGFQAGRVHAFDRTGENLAVAHAHNLLLESLCSMGFMGTLFVALVLLSLLAAVWALVRRSDAPPGPALASGWELAAMLVPYYAFCVLDSGFVTALDPGIMLFLVIAARAQRSLIAEQETSAVAVPQGGMPCPT